MSDKTVRIVTRVVGDEDVGDYSYALITLDSRHIRWILERMAMAKDLERADKEFYALTYFNYAAEYYEKLWVPDEDGNQRDIEYEESYVLPDDFIVGTDTLPIAAPTVIIQDNCVLWMAHPKHGGGSFETETLSEAFLRDRLAILEGVS